MKISKKNKILIFLICLPLVVCLYLYFEFYNHSYINIEKVSAEYSVSSDELVSSFMLNEETANSIYRNKLIEVAGMVKQVTFINDRNTILLHSNSKYSSVICDMQSDQIEQVKKLRPGDKITIKGICKGYLKDAILLNCMLINTNNHE